MVPFQCFKDAHNQIVKVWQEGGTAKSHHHQQDLRSLGRDVADGKLQAYGVDNIVDVVNNELAGASIA